MTKEELEKEARDYADNQIGCGDGYYEWTDIENAYLAGAEPREKRIEALERKLEQTEKDLTDYQFNYPKIKDLEKENAELKEHIKADCIDCVDYIKNKRLEKENASLKEQIKKMKEKHKQDELGLIISNSSARAELEKQLEQAKKYLEECVYNVVSPERLRKDIEQFLKELAE